MNRKMVFYMIGKIVQAEAAMLLLPLVVALLYKETPLPFLITIGIALVLGIALSLIFKPKDRVIYAKGLCNRGLCLDCPVPDRLYSLCAQRRAAQLL